MFKTSFKYYKSKNPPPSLKDVIDLRNYDENLVRKIILPLKACIEQQIFGLKSCDWNIYEFLKIPGLILIENPFTASGQRKWITKCLRDYTRKPNKLNIDSFYILSDEENWWDVCFSGETQNKRLISKLRWATLGYHYNWNLKEYSEKLRSDMPTELSQLTEFIARRLGFLNFKAQAAIINYYRMNSTLSGHTDHSEAFLEAPLISISFGQSAIFLIGGLKEEDSASALYLHSGDIVIMSKDSRLRYHGIPRIIPTSSKAWLEDQQDIENESDWKKAETYIDEARMNLSIRQVLKPGQNSL